MIDFHCWPTPNGWKVARMLEECRLAYRMISVSIQRGDQDAWGIRLRAARGSGV